MTPHEWASRYHIIYDDTAEDLADRVEAFLSWGWQPLGRPFVYHNSIAQYLVATSKGTTLPPSEEEE